MKALTSWNEKWPVRAEAQSSTPAMLPAGHSSPKIPQQIHGCCLITSYKSLLILQSQNTNTGQKSLCTLNFGVKMLKNGTDHPTVPMNFLNLLLGNK